MKIKEITNLCLYISIALGFAAQFIFCAGEEFKMLRCLLFANISAAFLILNKMDDWK